MYTPSPSQIFCGIIDYNGHLIRPAIYDSIEPVFLSEENHIYQLNINNKKALYSFEDDKTSDWEYNKIERLSYKKFFIFFKASLKNPFQDLYSIIYKSTLIYISHYDFDVYHIASEKAIVIKDHKCKKYGIVSDGLLCGGFQYSACYISEDVHLILLKNNKVYDVYNYEGRCIISGIDSDYEFEPYYGKEECIKISRHSNERSSYFLVTNRSTGCNRVYSYDGQFAFGIRDIYYVNPINEFFFFYDSNGHKQSFLFSIKDRKKIYLSFDSIERYFNNSGNVDISVDFYSIHRGKETFVLIFYKDKYKITDYSFITPIIPYYFYKDFGKGKRLDDILFKQRPNYYFYTTDQNLPSKNVSTEKLEGLWGVLNSKGEEIIPCKQCVIKVVDEYYFKIDNILYDATGKKYEQLEIVQTINDNSLPGTPYYNVHHLFGNVYRAQINVASNRYGRNFDQFEVLINREGKALSDFYNETFIFQYEKGHSDIIRYIIGQTRYEDNIHDIAIYKREGETIKKIPHRITRVLENSHLAICKDDNGKFGIINYVNDNIVKSFIYDKISVWNNTLFVKADNHYGFLNQNGEEITDMSLEEEPVEFSILGELVLCRIYPQKYFIYNRIKKDWNLYEGYLSCRLLQNSFILFSDKEFNKSLCDLTDNNCIFGPDY